MRRFGYILALFVWLSSPILAQEYWRWPPQPPGVFESITPLCQRLPPIGETSQGACANNLFYIEWSRSGGDLAWLEHGAREFVERLNREGPPSEGMISGVSFPPRLRWELLVGPFAFEISGPVPGFCVIGFSTPRAASISNYFYGNQFSRIELGAPHGHGGGWPFRFDPYQTFDFSLSEEQRLIRCFAGNRSGGVSIDFYPYVYSVAVTQKFLFSNIEVLMQAFRL